MASNKRERKKRKMTSEHAFDFLDTLSDNTDFEDNISEIDFDDDNSIADPNYRLSDDYINNCLNIINQESIEQPANSDTDIDISMNVMSRRQTTGESLKTDEPTASSTKSRKSAFKKRSRSPLPKFEDGEEIPEPNNGGFVGNVLQLTANSKECKEILWRKRNLQLPRNEVVFRGDSKLPESFKQLKTPYQCFTHFMTEEILRIIAEQTHLYARQVDVNINFSVTSIEIRRYIGILIFMSLYRYPNAAEYWVEYSFEPIRMAMPSKKFNMIRKHLHFNDTSKLIKLGEPGFDPLHKIRPLVDHFNARFETVPKLSRLCVDEQMCSTKMKWGFKLFVLCDSNTSAGSNTILPDMPDLSPAANIVVRLSQTIPKFVNHILFFDNFYTTLPLLVYLRTRGIYALGTIRIVRIPNCKLPSDKDKDISKAERGYSIEYSGNAYGVDLKTVLWKDNKNVRLASTYVGILPFKDVLDDRPHSKVARFNRSTRKYTEIDCPNIIKEYNYHMGGVDLWHPYFVLTTKLGEDLADPLL